jgi:YVTN family beta-propeller protein
VSIVVSARPLAWRCRTAVLTVLVLSACGGGGTEPETIGPPAAVVVSAGNEQVGQAGAVLTAPIAAKVTDAGGRGVANIPVTFAVTAGFGSIETPTSRTNGAGVATTNWRVGTAAGSPQQVVATVLDTLTGGLVDTAVFVATVTAGPPATVFSAAGHGSVIAEGQTTPVSLRAVVRDAYGNLVSAATVNWIVAGGQATLAAATSVTNSLGEATNTLTPGASTGDIQVHASVTGVSSAASFLVYVRRPVAVFPAGGQLAIAVGQTTPVTLRVGVRDQFGNGLAGVTVNWAVVQGQGTLAAPTSASNAIGEATNTLTPGASTGDLQVHASVAGVSSPASLVVYVRRPATVFPVGGSDLTIAVGQTTPVTLRVGVRDQLGSGLAGVTVDWTVVQGQGTLAAPTSVSNAGGEATNTLTPGQTTDDIVVRATVAGVSSPASFLIRPRYVSERAALLRAGAFGIARTPAGQLVVTLSHSGQLERISTTNPSNSTVAIVGGNPVVIDVDAAGQFAYVSNMARGTLQVIDVPSMAAVAEVDVPGEAHALALSPRGDRVYVTNTENSVFAVDVATRTIVRTIPTGSGPWGIAFWTTATDSLMYVTARNGNSITEADMRTGSALRTIAVTGRPHGIAISPDGHTLYVADDTGGEILFVSRVSGVTTRRITAAGAFGIAIAPDGNTLYVTTNAGFIMVVDVASATITKRFETGGEPRQILVMPGGDSALAANMGGWVDLVRR